MSLASVKAKINQGEFDNIISKVAQNKENCNKVGAFNDEIINFIKNKMDVEYEKAKELYLASAELLEKRCIKIMSNKKEKSQYYFKGGLLSSSLYYALYDAYGSEAVNIMYKILEDITTDALKGEKEKINFLHNFYSITTDENLEEQLNLLKQIIDNNKEIFSKVDMEVLKHFLCAKNDGYNLLTGNSSKQCENLFDEIIGVRSSG